MAFGNPYGDPWNIGEVVDAVELLESYGIRTISLADTVGVAGPAQIREVVSAVVAKYDYLEIGMHLHSRPERRAKRFLPPTKLVAGALILHSADWAGVRSPRTR